MRGKELAKRSASEVEIKKVRESERANESARVRARVRLRVSERGATTTRSNLQNKVHHQIGTFIKGHLRTCV